jgi:RHS repeat-associated protein
MYDINYFITDHLGSTRVIVDANGTVKGQYNYYPFGKQWEDANLMTNTNRYTFSGKEKQTVNDLGWLDFMARMYANSEIPRFTTQDPLSEKYYSWSPYVYCAGNPVNRIDPNGMDWYEFQGEDGNTRTMWRRSQDAEYTDDDGNVWNNIGENYLYVNGEKATLFTQHTNDNGELYLRSSAYNLADETENGSLLSTMGDLLSNSSSIAGAVGILGESSNATFRLTNSKGMLDFKFYGNGWKGNQWVAPQSLSKVGSTIKNGGNILSILSAGFSLAQISGSNTTLQNVGHGTDAAMSLIGMANVYTFAASLYYSHVMKNYPAIQRSVKQQLIDRASMMQRGLIPVGHPGFPFK